MVRARRGTPPPLLKEKFYTLIARNTMSAPKLEATENGGFNKASTSTAFSPATVSQPNGPEAIELQSLPSEPSPVMQTSSNGGLENERRLERLGILALIWAMFMVGWNDGTSGRVSKDLSFHMPIYTYLSFSGPLLPTMQKHYNVSSSGF